MAELTLPDRATLCAAFDTAVREIDEARDRRMLTNGFYAKIGDSIFNAGYQALQDFVGAQAAPSAQPPRLHVVSAPAGGGKTSFAKALLAAVVRATESGPNGPLGCLFLTDQRERADETYRDLAKLIPGRVAIWTADHDPNCKTPEKVKDPAARFAAHELADYPVVVTTYAFYKGSRGALAREFAQGGSRRPRALTFGDERPPNEVAVFEVTLSEAEQAREFIQQDPAKQEAAGPHVAALVRFMQDRTHCSRDLEKPDDAPEAWAVSNDLWWFRTQEAAQFAKRCPNTVPVDRVFGYARSVAEGYAFIARSHGGKGITRFVGYQSNLLRTHGMVLLDATADIDGVQQVCPWRVLQETARARYDNLEIVHVPPPTREKLYTFFTYAKNRTEYARWMRATILEHMQPGQRGLIVCKKTLFDNDNMPGDLDSKCPVKSSDLHTGGYCIDIGGRKLAATYWGHGIGANAWKDADVVFLFDEFHTPRRASITNAQGLQGHKATEGALATMRTQNSRAAKVDALSEGHLLRWSKQMCLRGNARSFDEHGLCGPQKLVCSGDQQRLLRNVNTLYPGAKVSLIAPQRGEKLNRTEALLAIFSDPDLPDTVSANFVGERFRKPWREIADVIRPKAVRESLEALGWRYVSKRGRGGSWFERIEAQDHRMAA